MSEYLNFTIEESVGPICTCEVAAGHRCGICYQPICETCADVGGMCMNCYMQAYQDQYYEGEV